MKSERFCIWWCGMRFQVQCIRCKVQSCSVLDKRYEESHTCNLTHVQWTRNKKATKEAVNIYERSLVHSEQNAHGHCTTEIQLRNALEEQDNHSCYKFPDHIWYPIAPQITILGVSPVRIWMRHFRRRLSPLYFLTSTCPLL